MPTPFYVAKKMGKKLGKRQILQRCLPHGKIPIAFLGSQSANKQLKISRNGKRILTKTPVYFQRRANRTREPQGV